MGDIALVNNDFVISKFGDISVTSDENSDILQQAKNNMFTIYGEMLHHQELGNKLFNNRHKITDDMEDIEAECEEAMLLDERIDSVSEINATKSDIVGYIDISFILVTIDGDTLSDSCTILIT